MAFGNRAKKMNGKAKALPKTAMPRIGRNNSPPAEVTSKVPTIGPVHEKDTRVSVNAMKKTPRKPPFLSASSPIFLPLFSLSF